LSPSSSASRISDFLQAQQHPENGSLEHQLNRTLRAMRSHIGMDVAFTSVLTDGRRLFNRVDTTITEGPQSVGTSCPLNVGASPADVHITVPVKLSNGQTSGIFTCFSKTMDPKLKERDQIMLRVFAEIATELIAADIEARHLLIDMESRIKGVLSNNSFSMVYQPIHHMMADKLIGFESLTRFSAMPHRSPDVWFHEAAQVGLDIDLECRAIQLALDAMHFLPSDIFISVNASPKTIISGDLQRLFQGWPLSRIILEVTEHAIIDLYGELSAALSPLRHRGLRLAIDDAGAGYSSFRHIINLEPDIIKLDMSLTRNIDTHTSRRALAAALVHFANETGSEIIAEGVETASELAVLRELGIQYAQGFFLGKPRVLGGAATERRDNTALIA
jgi:EAL domain-containing protein (putative c-di-GMP-specific phosphodiesterase class I)